MSFITKCGRWAKEASQKVRTSQQSDSATFTVINEILFHLVFQCRRGSPFSETDKDVALKIVPKTRVAKQSQREKIDAEIQIQRMMDHPNIVKLLHSFEDHNKICLVVELCERKSLTTLMKNKGPVSRNFLNAESEFSIF